MNMDISRITALKNDTVVTAGKEVLQKAKRDPFPKFVELVYTRVFSKNLKDVLEKLFFGRSVSKTFNAMVKFAIKYYS